MQYPVSSTWEFTLSNDEIVKGEVYCTDPVSEQIVLQDQLNDIRMVSISGIRDSKQVEEATEDASIPGNMTHSRKALEERERRAIRLAEESFKHINPKVCDR